MLPFDFELCRLIILAGSKFACFVRFRTERYLSFELVSGLTLHEYYLFVVWVWSIREAEEE